MKCIADRRHAVGDNDVQTSVSAEAECVSAHGFERGGQTNLLKIRQIGEYLTVQRRDPLLHDDSADVSVVVFLPGRLAVRVHVDLAFAGNRERLRRAVIAPIRVRPDFAAAVLGKYGDCQRNDEYHAEHEREPFSESHGEPPFEIG